MMDEVAQAVDGIDLVAVMIDASAGMTREDRWPSSALRDFRGPCISAAQQNRPHSKPALLPLLETCCAGKGFHRDDSDFGADGRRRGNSLLERFIAHLPEGRALFPADQYTDQPERFLAAEIVREKAMSRPPQEVPHAVAVIVRCVRGKRKADSHSAPRFRWSGKGRRES